MRLNSLSPAEGSNKNKKRVGRGIGCGFGKTCGRGHKGQHSRSGGYHKVGFEGGQMPLQRRVPKFGFRSRKALKSMEIRLGELSKIPGDVIDFDALLACKLIYSNTKQVKVFLSGKIDRAITLKGIPASKGAQAAIIAAGGKIEE
jgi:large subunit ribosomal protein L15